MTTCFLFVEQFDDEQFLSLCLNEDGQVITPLVRRSIDELRALQLNAKTIVVLPAQRTSFHTVELPWLGDRKARAAIPFALEEQLAQNVTTVHVAFDRKHYQNNHYVVAIIDKAFLTDLIARFDAANLSFDLITIDWFALTENEACVTERGLLVNDNVFKGALSGELSALYLKDRPKAEPLLMFTDSLPVKEAVTSTLVEELSAVWLAKRLLKATPMNLCQGALQHDTTQQSGRYWYKASAFVAGALLASVVLFNIVYLYSLNASITELDIKIAVIYREFFPGASQIISPKFRIGQLLKGGSANSDTVSLWTLVDKLAQTVNGDQLTIDQLRFQRHVLSVTLTSKNFAALEDLQQRLQQAKVKVTQAQASSQSNQVKAILELSL